MNTELDLWGYFLQASLLVKITMLLLWVASIISWTLIFQRARLLRQLYQSKKTFERQFWSGTDLTQLYESIRGSTPAPEGLANIFYAGFLEFTRLRAIGCQQLTVILEAVQRAMGIAYAQTEDRLERHLSWLATIGSSSPYVGLLGTVWGIMGAFRSLAGAGQTATLALVAPGISEALVATAMGLFTAIPAVIFYNRYVSQIDGLLKQYRTFQEEFIGLLVRQIYGGVREKSLET